MPKELQSIMVDNPEVFTAVNEMLKTLTAGRKSREKFNGKFWTDLRDNCKKLAIVHAEQVEFIDLGSPQSFHYAHKEPYVLCQRIEVVIKFKNVDHLMFSVINIALTADYDAQLIGRTGPYIGVKE